MTQQEEIREAARTAKQEIQKARAEVDVAIAKWKVIVAICEHPDRYETSCMGESCTYCPDCGHST